MTLRIVPFYAAVFGLIYVTLSFRVADTRRTLRVLLGSGGNVTLERRIRVHGNFSEYVPLALILFSFVEMQGWSGSWVHGLCLAMLAARVVHAYGVSREPEDIRFRATAMISNLVIITAAALLLLVSAAR